MFARVCVQVCASAYISVCTYVCVSVYAFNSIGDEAMESIKPLSMSREQTGVCVDRFWRPIPQRTVTLSAPDSPQRKMASDEVRLTFWVPLGLRLKVKTGG